MISESTRRIPVRTRTVALALWLAASAGLAPQGRSEEPPVATFSIVAFDSLEGEWGVAVASRFLAVGSVVPWARAGSGAVAVQAVSRPSFGPEGLALLEGGEHPDRALARLLAGDDRPEIRQVGLVDGWGRWATHTGERCQEWAGGKAGPGYAIQGNGLAYEDVVLEMERAFLGTRGDLAERLVSALRAGHGEGGDRKGVRAAALLVVKEKGGYGGWNDRYVDLRVDDAEDPIAELDRLYALHAKSLLPAVHTRLGNAAEAAGDKERSEREYARVLYLYRRAIERFPDDGETKNALAWFLARRRMNLDEAMALAEEAHRALPASWEVLDTLAEIHYAKGHPDRARDMSLQALEADPENPYLKSQAQRFAVAAERAGMR